MVGGRKIPYLCLVSTLIWEKIEGILLNFICISLLFFVHEYCLLTLEDNERICVFVFLG